MVHDSKKSKIKPTNLVTISDFSRVKFGNGAEEPVSDFPLLSHTLSCTPRLKWKENAKYILKIS